MKTTLDSIEINPQQKEIGTVIWLHGLGADGNDFVPLVPELNLPKDMPLRFVFPNAPHRAVTINNGYVMPAWYDIYAMGNHDRVDSEGILESTRQLEKLIEHEEKRGIPPEKVVVAGFSQGAVIALTTGLGYSKSLAGILALSGYLPDSERVLNEANAANFTTPIFVAHGTEDMVVPFAAGLNVYNALQKNKYRVSWHNYVMPHSVCGEEIGDIAEWLRKVFQPA